VTLQDAYRFFVPLVLMIELNMISKSAIHAFLARTDSPSVTLAAFSVAFTFFYTITSATEVATPTSLSYLRDRRSARRIVGFFFALLSVPLTLVAMVAFTGAGDWLYGTLFGASEAAVAQAKAASFALCFSTPFLILRALAFALLMLNRRTLLITWSTFVRLLTLGVSLLVWPSFLEGAAVGAAALATCMAAESVFAWIFAWRHLRELVADAGEPPPGPGTLWRFCWPLALNQSAELGVVFVINLFLGRLASPDLALAAFGVAHGLVGLLMGPLRNLAQTAQTLIATPADVRTLSRFATQLVVGFATLAVVLFWTPLRGWVLATVMGLGVEIQAVCEPGMRVAFAMAPFWAFSALFRGRFAARKQTTVLAFTGGLRIATAAGVVALVALVRPDTSGAVLGLSAWILAYAVEAAILRVRLGRTVDTGG
jgi:hypothetical protein